MPRATLFAVDGIGNVALGVILLAEPVRLATWLGIPNVTSGFYPSLFGAVLLGIGLALLLKLYRPSSGGGSVSLAPLSSTSASAWCLRAGCSSAV